MNVIARNSDDCTAAPSASGMKNTATLQALATPSRLRILTRLRHGACSVSELTDAVEMEQSAVSHQLRLLRALGLVTTIRKGRTVVAPPRDHKEATTRTRPTRLRFTICQSLGPYTATMYGSGGTYAQLRLIRTNSGR